AFDLVLNTSGVTSFSNVVGGSSALNSLTTNAGGSTSIASNISTTGAQTFNDAVTLTGSGTFASSGSGNIGFGSTLNGAFDLVLNTSGITSFGNIVGGSSALNSLTTNAGGSTSIGSNITTVNAQTFNDSVNLAGDSTLQSNSNGDIHFSSTLDGAKALAVNTAGVSFFGAEVGGTTALTSLTTNAGGSTSIDGNMTTSGTQTYNDTVNLANDSTFQSNSGGDVHFSSTLDGAKVLAVNTSGVSFFGAAVGGTSALTSVTTDAAGSTSIDGNITTTGAQTFNDAAVLAGNNTLQSNSSGDIHFSSTVNGTSVLAVNTAGTSFFGAAVGGTTPLTSVTTDSSGGTSIVSNVSTTGAQTYNDAVVLAGSGNKTFSSSGSGNIGFGGTLDGASDVILNTGGTLTLGNLVGNTTPLNTLTANPALTVINGGIVKTASTQFYNAVSLGNNTTLQITGSGNMTLGNIQGNNFNLTATGGSGSNDLIVSTNAANQIWNISGANSGNIAGISGLGTFNFSSMETLTGGINSDTFALNGSTFNGAINGGLGSNSLVADNTLNNWTLSGVNSGTVTGITGGFANIQNLTGGSADDNFILSGGGVSTINGGAGTNLLQANNGAAYIWNITGNNAGSINGVVGGFSNIENLTGGTGTDTFVLNNNSKIGLIDGGDATALNNTLNTAGYNSGPYTIDVNQTGTSQVNNNLGQTLASFVNVDKLVGNTQGLLTLPNKTNSIQVTELYTGSINDPVFFNGYNSLMGQGTTSLFFSVPAVVYRYGSDVVAYINGLPMFFYNISSISGNIIPGGITPAPVVPSVPSINTNTLFTDINAINSISWQMASGSFVASLYPIDQIPLGAPVSICISQSLLKSNFTNDKYTIKPVKDDRDKTLLCM
ncbi:MAG TPA: hypothetical protein VLI69_06265, partial [Gammaproteobacteria bacterium]|nr:hypothetical protein [Gammaproteobacteria bacterium]